MCPFNLSGISEQIPTFSSSSGFLGTELTPLYMQLLPEQSSHFLMVSCVRKQLENWRTVLPCCLPPRPQRRFTCPWAGSTASARSCVSREDLSDSPAVPPDELQSDVAAAKSLTSQTSLTYEAQYVEPHTLC